MSQVRGNLPPGWAITTLGEATSIEMGQSPSGLATNTDGKGIPLIGGASDFSDGSLSPSKYTTAPTKLSREGDVILCIRATIGRAAIAHDQFCLGRGVAGIRTPPLTNLWILQYLKKSEDELTALGTGTTFKQIDKKKLSSFRLPVAPVNEQKRIVAKIEELQARSRRTREALEPVPDLLEQLRQSLLASAFRGDLTKEWRRNNPDVEPASELLKRIRTERRERWEDAELEKLKAKGLIGKELDEEFAKWCKRYREPTPPNTTILPSLPVGWCWTNWDQISNWVTYGFTRPMPHVDEGPVIITAKDVVAGRINFLDSSRTEPRAFESLSEKDRPQPGDILLTKDGTIGRAAVVPPDSPPFCINQSVAVIWFRSCSIHRTFLLRSIESPTTQQHIKDRSKGMAIQHLSVTDFGKIALPLPPIEEQEEIIRIMEE